MNIPGLPDEDLGYEKWSTWTTSSVSNFTEETGIIDNYYYDYTPHYYVVYARSLQTGLYTELKVTGEHELFIKDSDNIWKWMKAGNCKVGQSLLSDDLSTIEIESITKINEEVEVVNLDVEPFDVYIVNGIVAHNKGTNDAP